MPKDEGNKTTKPNENNVDTSVPVRDASGEINDQTMHVIKTGDPKDPNILNTLSNQGTQKEKGSQDLQDKSEN